MDCTKPNGINSAFKEAKGTCLPLIGPGILDGCDFSEISSDYISKSVNKDKVDVDV